MIVDVYKLNCLTNLHVGAGDINYSIIDNEVEKDPVTGIAMIHSTGMKGALKDFLNKELNNIEKQNYDFIKAFGTEKIDKDSIEVQDKTKNENQKESSKASVPGEYKFFSANLLARPFRISEGTGNEAFVNMTTSYIVLEFLKMLEQFGIKQLEFNEDNIVDLEGLVKEEFLLKEERDNNIYVSDNTVIEEVEGIKTKQIPNTTKIDDLLKQLIGKNYAIMSQNDFKEYELPIIARNCLEDGISKNLWYEEIVPHHSCFYFFVLRPEDLADIMSQTKDKVIQFGGHASIGYGFSTLERIGGTADEQKENR